MLRYGSICNTSPHSFLHPRQTAFAGFWCSPRRSTQSPCSPYRCEASGLYTPVRLHLHMQDPQCRGYSSPAVDTHPCSHSSHHSHPLAQRRICQCCHPAHPVRKQHRGPVRSVLCRMIRCNFRIQIEGRTNAVISLIGCITQNIPLRGHKSHIMVTGCNRCTQPIVPCYTASVFAIW